ncbi:glycerol kinase GlpK [Eubacteriales bacterium OttesenSCG-928-N13]|nr:glycerol kinase GlpK [Eubacteriales bacterium OttesenSCG-928-N13]
MSALKYILSLDQGTTSSRAVLFDQKGQVVALHSIEFPQLFPEPGWVEHDPYDILQSQLDSLKQVVQKSAVHPKDIMAVGITNQRETTLIWDRVTGKPLCNAIVWQCRRTAPLVERLKQDGLGNVIRDRTGLIPDAYFSGTKIQWMLEQIPGAQERAENGELCFGTVDSWLTYNLTEEKPHVTDATNAARTMLFNIYEQDWDEMLLRAMNIPALILPKVVDTSGIVGHLKKEILGESIPVAALVGDQHAALFGQVCFQSGMVKNTYGTGCFMLMNTGSMPVRSMSNLVTTIGWRLDGKPCYALEGSVFMAGASIQWLRDEMKMISTSAESEEVAKTVADSGGVYLVPAFTGLGAPHWDMYARGTIVGLTRGAGRGHVVRAALESIAYQSRDVLDAMIRDSGLKPSVIRVDGGASRNNLLMQFQADITGTQVLRSMNSETTALGAAMLAGLAVGMWTQRQLEELWLQGGQFDPQMDGGLRATMYNGWQRAVERAKDWAEL